MRAHAYALLGMFTRALRAAARVFVLGLLADLPRKNFPYLLAAGHGSGVFRSSLRALGP